MHEFTFWFRLLPLMGSLSALMEGRSGIPGGLGAEKRGGAPDRTAAVSPSVGPAQLAAGRALLPLHFGYSSLPFGLISLDLVNYRSSSDRCRCFFVLFCFLFFFLFDPSAVFLPLPFFPSTGAHDPPWGQPR